MVTFHQPRTRNALNRATRVALVEELERADADREIRVIVLTGSGSSFSSGVDAKELLATAGYVPPPIDPPSCLRALDTPTIAAVNGSCVSGGLEIALACSFIIAAESARFADTHTKIGLTPGWSLSAELPAAVGVARARQLSLTGHPIDAQTALVWGLVNEVVPDERLLSRCGELARSISAMNELSLGHTVELYRRGHESRVGQARELERAALAEWKVDAGDSLERFSQRGGAD